MPRKVYVETILSQDSWDGFGGLDLKLFDF